MAQERGRYAESGERPSRARPRRTLTLEMVPEAFGPDVRALHVRTLGLVLEPMASTLVDLVRRERGRRLIMLTPTSGLVWRTRSNTAIVSMR